MYAHPNKGFSLLELMVVIAIVGIVSAIAMPAYRSYIDTANMSKVNAAYENAVQVAQREFAKNQSQAALGISYPLPQTSNAWAQIFDPGGSTQAPGGGWIYDTSNQTGNYGNSGNGGGPGNGGGRGGPGGRGGRGGPGNGGGPGNSGGNGNSGSNGNNGNTTNSDNITGAVMVQYNSSKGELDIYRPAYLDLKPLRAQVTVNGITITEL